MQFLQDLLLLAIEAIVIATVVFIAVDIVEQARFFGGYQIPVGWKPEMIAVEINRATDIKASVTATPVTVFPDPWLVDQDVEALIIKPKLVKQPEQKPMLLLPPARITNQALIANSDQSGFSYLLLEMNLNKLKLRPARKIAKTLNISQKINGRDQSLSYLREQIKARLQDKSQLSADVLEAVSKILAS